MHPLDRDLVFLVLQFLNQGNFKEAMHKLEEESGLFFNMRYYQETAMNGKWEEAEKYMLGFTKVEENRQSLMIFFEIRKMKYLEALDKGDRARAVDILAKDLKVFSDYNQDLYKKLAHLITLDNFREYEELSKVGDIKSARFASLNEIKKQILADPRFRDKLRFPTLNDSSRLKTLMLQSIKWQHKRCKNGEPYPTIESLFENHRCGASTSESGVGVEIKREVGAEIKREENVQVGAEIKREEDVQGGAGSIGGEPAGSSQINL